ncbi:MAG: TadE/TadG family type IV pilus assembly protein [Dehalococcoidia bacterium]
MNTGSTADLAGSDPAQRRWWTRWRETDAGQTLVEFSLILPLMLVLLFALVDFGRGFYTWLIVTNAAREGARAGATQMDVPSIEAKIYDSFCSDYAGGDCGLDETLLSIAVANAQGPRGEAIEVDLSYDFEFVTPMGDILVLLGGSAIANPTITAHSSMRLE